MALPREHERKGGGWAEAEATDLVLRSGDMDKRCRHGQSARGSGLRSTWRVAIGWNEVDADSMALHREA